MLDRRTIRVFMSGMASMSLLCFLAIGVAVLYNRWTHDPAEDAAFAAQMAEHDAFLQEHVRKMDAYQRQWEARRQAHEAHDEVLRVETQPCP